MIVSFIFVADYFKFMAKSLHKKNVHNNGYDFQFLAEKFPELKGFIIEKYEKETIDFSNPVAVKTFNKALLVAHYGLNYWEFPTTNLCPPIPGRVDYIHHVYDIISGEKNVRILDIGTGASCVYPLLGASVYDWKFVGTDIDKKSLKFAEKNVLENGLETQIQLRLQAKKEHVLEGVLHKEDAFTCTMCNPPFYKSEQEALFANTRKSKNLGTKEQRNFSGTANELWYKGGEKAFLHTYLYESSQYPTASLWFTSLVSQKENVKSLESSGKKLGVKELKVIPMHQGNKITRIVCWRF